MNRSQCSLVIVAFAGLAACQNTGPKGLIGNYRIGERVQVGAMLYNIYETQYLVKIGEGTDAHIPKERYFVIHLSAVNSGGDRTDEAIPTFTLVDDQGASYNELDYGTGLPQWIGFARKVHPADSLTGDIVFDVAPKHYKLRIANDTDTQYALVDLPLSFGEESAPAPVDNAPSPR